jgi:WD40 repeat protein
VNLQLIRKLTFLTLIYLLVACNSSKILDAASIEPALSPASTIPSLPRPIRQVTPTLEKKQSPEPVLKYDSWEIIHDLTYSPEGSLLAVSAGNKVFLYNADPLILKFTLSPGVWTNRLAFHPTARLIALAVRDGSIQFWNTNTGTLVCQFTAHAKGANSLSINPDGSLLATTGTDITSRLWDMSSVGKGGCNVLEGGKLIGESFSSPDVAFSPDGKCLALVDLTNIRLRNSADRKLIALLPGDLPIYDIAFSPDGRWLAAAEYQDTAALWDVSQPTKPSLSVLSQDSTNPKVYLWRVAFSPNSNLLATGASDGTLTLWDLSTQKPIKAYLLPRAISALSFSPDGKSIVAGGLDAAVWVLPLEP